MNRQNTKYIIHNTGPRLNAKQLRASRPTKSDLVKIKRREIYIICDNILDAYNIGSIFRLADAVGVSKIYLCGETQTPPYHRIAKAAVGTEKWVPWEHVSTALDAIKEVRSLKSEVRVVAIERGKGSVDYRKIDFQLPIAFVVGHETTGGSREAAKVCDALIEIPMYGANRSLNEVLSLALVLF